MRPRPQSIRQLARSRLLSRWVATPAAVDLRLREIDAKIVQFVKDATHNSYFEEQLVRFRRAVPGEEMYIKGGMDLGWARTFALYINGLSADRRNLVEHWLTKTRGIWHDSRALFAVFKELSGLYKWAGELANPDWRFMINLELFGGYQETLEFDEAVEKAKKWLGNTQERYGVPGDEDAWEAEFREQARKACKEITDRIKSADDLTFQDYMRHPIYRGSAGSSDGKPARVEINGREQAARKSKWASALTSDPIDLEREYVNYVGPKIYVFVKREKGKARLVARVDNKTNDLEGFILAHMERGMKNVPCYPLTHDNVFSVKESDKLAERLAAGGVGLPVDGVEFDHNVRKQQNYRVTYEELIAQLANKSLSRSRADVLGVGARLLDGFRHGVGRVYVQRGKKSASFDWTSGFVSGSRLTAALEQIILIAHARTVVAMAERRLAVNIKPSCEWGQGDDYSAVVDSVTHGALYCELWAAAGFPVNPNKNFIGGATCGGARTEFLRKVITADGGKGYPARVISSIVWRNPISSEDGQFASARGVLDLWHTAIGRGYEAASAKRFIVGEVCRVSRLKSSDVVNALGTPIPNGGFGWHELFGSSYEQVAVDERPNRPTWHIVSQLSGLVFENAFATTQPWGQEAVAQERNFFRDRIVPKQFRPKVESVAKRVTPIWPDQGGENRLKRLEQELATVTAPGILSLRTSETIRQNMPTIEPLYIETLVLNKQWQLLKHLLQSSFDPMGLLSNADRTLTVDAITGHLPSFSPVLMQWSGAAAAAFSSQVASLVRRASSRWTYNSFRSWCFGVSTITASVMARRHAVWGP